jgi:hypothetical protein
VDDTVLPKRAFLDITAIQAVCSQSGTRRFIAKFAGTCLKSACATRVDLFSFEEGITKPETDKSR